MLDNLLKGLHNLLLAHVDGMTEMQVGVGGKIRLRRNNKPFEAFLANVKNFKYLSKVYTHVLIITF